MSNVEYWNKMIVIYHARTFSLMHTVEDRLISYTQKQIDRGKFDCEIINEKDSQRARRAKTPNGYWVYVLVQR